MTKADLADAIYRRHGALSRKEAADLVDLVIHRIRRGLAAGEAVKISGFGSFAVVRRTSRSGRNPRTGERVTIPGHASTVFRPSRQVLLRLNPGGGRKAEGGTRDGH
jgi:integration host factor subunit alpha